MSNDIEYVNGLIVKAPNERAPEFVKASLSIKREDLIAWLQGRSDDWINCDMKVSKSGKWFVAVNAWKPNSDKPSGQRQERQQSRQEPVRHADASNGFVDDQEIPFAPIPLRRHW